MGKHLEEKSLIAVNENSLFYKIKSFFLKLFRGKKNALNGFSIIPVEKMKFSLINEKMILLNLLEMLKMNKLNY